MLNLRVSKNNGILAAVILAGFLVRLVLIFFRWINPDEGAHLLDARLFLEGQTPIADFGSRQPLYVGLITLFLKIGGVHLWIGRLMPVLASAAGAVCLYLLGKKVFSERAGILAAAFSSFLPLTIIWSTVVKTEPLTILFSCVSMLFLISALSKEGFYSLFFSGIFAACAFFVRQPALYLPITTLLFMLFHREKMVQRILSYAAGYLLVVLIIAMAYWGKLTLSEWAFSQLNPATLILSRLFYLIGKVPDAYKVVDEGGFRILDQSISYTLNAWKEALTFCAVIVLPALFTLFRPPKTRPGFHQVRLLLFLWAGVVLLLYAFQSANRGFYTQYFTEALPPLILLAGAAAAELFDHFSKRRSMTLIGVLALFIILFVIRKKASLFLPSETAWLMIAYFISSLIFPLSSHATAKMRGLYDLVLPIGTIGFVSLFGNMFGFHPLFVYILTISIIIIYFILLEKKRLAQATFKNLFIFSFLSSAVFSGSIIGPRYEAVWSPQTLRESVDYFKTHGMPSDQVISGAMIWTFESGLTPFLNVPHPTELLKKRLQDFENYFNADPPQFIIIDGYTQRKFAKYWDFITERMNVGYEKTAVISGSKYPVEIYQLAPRLHAPAGFWGRLEAGR